MPQFGPDAPAQLRTLCAGPTLTAGIDTESRLWVAGAWRRSDDGGPGQSFQIYKPLDELADMDVHAIAAGADVMQCLAAPSGSNDASWQVLGWGDGALHAELGAEVPPARPAPVADLAPLAIVGVASGRHTSFWLARPDAAYAELARFPDNVESASACLVCGQGGEEDAATLLECGMCENPYHLACLSPPLDAVPLGEWLCAQCRAADVGGAEPAPLPPQAPPKSSEAPPAPAAPAPAPAPRSRKRRKA